MFSYVKKKVNKIMFASNIGGTNQYFSKNSSFIILKDGLIVWYLLRQFFPLRVMAYAKYDFFWYFLQNSEDDKNNEPFRLPKFMETCRNSYFYVKDIVCFICWVGNYDITSWVLVCFDCHDIMFCCCLWHHCFRAFAYFRLNSFVVFWFQGF